MARVTSMSRMRRDAADAIREEAVPSRGEATKRIAIGVAITVISAAVIAIGVRLFTRESSI